MNEKELKELKKNATWRGDVEAAKKLAFMYMNGKEGVDPSIQESMKWFDKAASKGDVESMGWMGWLYLGNKGYQKEEDKAFKWLKRACEAGDYTSMYFLAMCYRRGTGVKVNLNKSVQWLENGVNAQASNCMYELGLMYLDGIDGVEKNERKAAYYMEMSAKHNEKRGMYYLGNFYNQGRGVEKDKLKALEWWKKSAEAGCTDAKYELGVAYLRWNFTPDPKCYYKDGVFWLESADKEGNKKAAQELGVFYEKKINDIETAIKWYKKAADLESDMAKFSLGIIYTQQKQGAEAVKWFTKAADAGLKSAMSVLGELYYEGEIVAPDYEKAKYYIEKGYDPNIEPNIHVIARFYYNEYFSKKTEELYNNALKYMKEFAGFGNVEAMYKVGNLYMDSNGTLPENVREAEVWYKKAAQKENIFAMYKLACIYIENNDMLDKETGAKKEYWLKQGREWMEKAAEKNLKQAVIFVGDMYYNGKYGASVDGAKAVYWLKRAADDCKDPRSCCDLGLAYAKGYGKTIDWSEIYKYIKMGADMDDGKSYHNLACLYKRGLGVEKDYDEAIKFFKKSIEKNYMVARNHYEIGCLYKEKGDRKSAIEWLEKSAECGYKEAQKELNELYELRANEKSAMDELNSYIGLNKVKQKMQDFADALKMKERRRKLGQESEDNGFMHMVFTGNPGTGKTEVAKLVARILCEIGVISNPEPVIAERGDLVAEYVGQTEKKTNAVIEKALGGVLFIDEAYTLSKGGDKDFGKEAIDALLTAMVKYRDNLVVIAAGYTDDMDKFLATNQGLKSRFGTIIEFEDYTADELYAIFERLCEKQKFVVEKDAEWRIKDYLSKRAGSTDFGNARGVGRYFQEIKERQGKRLLQINESLMTEEEIRNAYVTIIAEDIEQMVERKDHEKSAMEELNSYIGLNKVKQKMRELEISVKMRKRRQELGMDVGNSGFLHMVFTGNPGTGKTEVAKIVARVLCEIGVLSNPKPIIVERGDLVAEFIGQTEKKTNEVIEKALGGVLFIDEAYTLSKVGGNDKDFGQEAIDAILTAMVKYREKLVVIAAGYTDDMERFLESNKGLKSRFGEIIEFEDYTAEELYEIFNSLVEKRGFILTDRAKILVQDYLAGKAGNYEFGNGRGVDRYFKSIMSEQDKRLSVFDETGLDEEQIKELYRTFIEEDVMAAYA